MTQANASSLSPSLNALPRAAAILAALVGAAVLAGWSLDIAVLKSVVPFPAWRP